MLIMRDVIHNGLGFRVDGNIRGALSSTVQSAAEPVDEQSSTSVSGRMVTRKRGIGAINTTCDGGNGDAATAKKIDAREVRQTI